MEDVWRSGKNLSLFFPPMMWVPGIKLRFVCDFTTVPSHQSLVRQLLMWENGGPTYTCRFFSLLCPSLISALSSCVQSFLSNDWRVCNTPDHCRVVLAESALLPQGATLLRQRAPSFLLRPRFGTSIAINTPCVCNYTLEETWLQCLLALGYCVSNIPPQKHIKRQATQEAERKKG